MSLKLPERRRFIRIEVPMRVTVTAGDRQEEVVTKNISPIGMRFEVPEPFEAEQSLQLILCLPLSGESIQVEGK